MTTRILVPPTTNAPPPPKEQVFINLARLGWFILALTLLGIFIYSLPYVRVQLRATECIPVEVTLDSAGIPFDTCIEFNVLLDWLVLIPSFSIAALVAWKRGHEWLG